MTDQDKLDALVQHIQNVQQNCLRLGEKLISSGEADLGRQLIANGFIHDYSKFYGIEWDYLSRDNVDKEKLAMAVQQHNRTNPHHPEYWGGIANMPRLYLAEMVCDWKTRSNEFGSSLIEWVNGAAAKRYGYSQRNTVYKEIVYFVNLLCDQPFSELKTTADAGV